MGTFVTPRPCDLSEAWPSSDTELAKVSSPRPHHGYFKPLESSHNVTISIHIDIICQYQNVSCDYCLEVCRNDIIITHSGASPVIFSRLCHPWSRLWAIIENMISLRELFKNYSADFSVKGGGCTPLSAKGFGQDDFPLRGGGEYPPIPLRKKSAKTAVFGQKTPINKYELVNFT